MAFSNIPTDSKWGGPEKDYVLSDIEYVALEIKHVAPDAPSGV
jgi:hypothetical protein